jgi:hypothetical protein
MTVVSELDLVHQWTAGTIPPQISRKTGTFDGLITANGFFAFFAKTVAGAAALFASGATGALLCEANGNPVQGPLVDASTPQGQAILAFLANAGAAPEIDTPVIPPVVVTPPAPGTTFSPPAAPPAPQPPAAAPIPPQAAPVPVQAATKSELQTLEASLVTAYGKWEARLAGLETTVKADAAKAEAKVEDVWAELKAVPKRDWSEIGLGVVALGILIHYVARWV